MLMVYGEHANNLAKKMNSRADKYFIADRIADSESIETIAATMADYDAVVLNDIDTDIKNLVLKEAYDQKKRVYFTPKISDILVKNADELHLFDTPLYLCRNLGLTASQKFIKKS